MDRIQYVLALANGVAKARTIKRLPPSEIWNGSFWDEAHGRELARNELDDDGGRVGIREPVLQPHARQFLHQHWCMNFERCDERHHVELIFNSLGAQTVALGVPTQELVVNKRSIVQNSVVPAWRQLGDHQLKILLRLERARERFAQFCRGTGLFAMRAKEEQPRAPPASRVLESGVRSNNQEGGSSSSSSSSSSGGSAMPASDSPPLEKRVCDKKIHDRCTSRTTGSAKEAPGATNSA